MLMLIRTFQEIIINMQIHKLQTVKLKREEIFA